MSWFQLAHWSIVNLRAAVWRFSSLAKKYPFVTSGVFMGARYFIGDAIVQQSNSTWDQRRSTTFFVFGITSGYVWGRVINQIYPFLLRTLNLKNRLWMIVLEGAFYIPFIYYPWFYLTQDFIVNNHFSLSRAWKLYLKNIQSDYIAWSKFWPASMFVSIVLLPNHLIPVFSAIVGLLWVIILSGMRGDLPEDKTHVTSDQGVKLLERTELECSDGTLHPVLVD